MVRVLVVDDDPQVRSMVEIALTTHGHDAAQATNGKMALGLLRQRSYDVLLTDILMPDMDGLELLRSVLREFPALRVVAMSGGSSRLPGADSLRTATKLGAHAVLHKPFTLAEALAAINEQPAES